MTTGSKPFDLERVYCEVCATPVPKSEAFVTEGNNFIVYFCGARCYESWQGERAPGAPPHERQEGHGRSPSQDDLLKRIERQHPQRDRRRVESVEPDDVPRA